MMIITLTDKEIREALISAVAEKTAYTLGTIIEDDSWFEVNAAGKQVDDIEGVMFSVKIDT